MQRKARTIATVLGLATLLAGLVPCVASAATIEQMLESKELTTAYNPVLLDYLLAEGKTALGETTRKEALDQVVTALKKAIEITPGEQRAAALATAAAGIAELFGGGGLTSELGDAAGDATHEIWQEWVDSAFTLQRAGYEDDARAFFANCVEVFPYADLRGRCAVGLALGDPDAALEKVFALTEEPDNNTVRTALRILGEMAASDDLPDDKKAAIIDRIEDFTGGLKKATYGVAACQALVLSKDPRAIDKLRDLSKGIMNQDISPCAQRGLLLTFDDRSVVPEIEKKLKGGFMDTTKPHEKLAAATLLIEAGEAKGYDWATTQFTGESKAKDREKALAKRGKEKGREKMDDDFRDNLVSVLVRTGGEQALPVLRDGFAMAKTGSWIETWIAIGMYELGDDTHQDLVQAALRHDDWDFTVIRAASALAKKGDFAGIDALGKLYDSALSRRPRNDQDRDRLLRLRRQIADALGAMDQPEGAALLARMLEDPDPGVRAASAYALARMNDPAALGGLRKAMTVDYGEQHGKSRTPVVLAHLVRRAAQQHAGRAELKPVVDAAIGTPWKSVQFLALCEQKGAGA